jgi:hypothetical protein
MAEPAVTVVRCRACRHSDRLTLSDGRFGCAWCQRWAEVDAEHVLGAEVGLVGDDLRLAPVPRPGDWLQPLRVPPGWRIERNVLPDADLDPVRESQIGDRNLFFATNDAARRAIDVDWRVELGPPVGGSYLLRFLPMTEATQEEQQRRRHTEPLLADWQNPLHQFETTSRLALVAELEACTRGERG